MQASNTRSSVTQTCNVQQFWWTIRVASACILMLLALTLIIGWQLTAGWQASSASNDPPWPGPTGVHTVQSFL